MVHTVKLESSKCRASIEDSGDATTQKALKKPNRKAATPARNVSGTSFALETVEKKKCSAFQFHTPSDTSTTLTVTCRVAVHP